MLISRTKSRYIHAIVISDYNKGFLKDAKKLRSKFDGPIFVDTKKKIYLSLMVAL